MTELTDVPFWIAIPTAFFLVLAGIIAIVGTLGLIRLPTFYTRIHAPTMGNTLGVFCIVVASMVLSSYIEQRLVVHQLLITILLVITSPHTAILLMRSAIRRKVHQSQLDAQSDKRTTADKDLSTPGS